MRSARTVCVILFVLTLAAVAKTDISAEVYGKQARFLLGQTDSPRLLIGQITSVYTNPLPCRVGGFRPTTWAISRTLYGFPPGDEIKILFPSCGALEPEFKSTGDLLVLVYPGGKGNWFGDKALILPATDANIHIASRALDSFLRRKIREVLQPSHNGSPRPALIFTGTVIDPGPHHDQPCVSTVMPVFPMKFSVQQILRGNWTEPEVTVNFPGCSAGDGPPYRVGEKVIVFAIPMDPHPPVIVRGYFALPTSQLEEAQSAIAAVESQLARK